MSDVSTQKKAGILATIVIGLVVVSFMFSGYDSMKGSPDTIAKVGNQPIKIDEFSSEYSRIIQLYGKLMGGKDLTEKQIEQFQIKETALRNLVQKKLMVTLGENFKIIAAPEFIAKEIQKMPYFLTNNQFDLNKYKAILESNRFTPVTFEKTITEDMKLQSLSTLLSRYPVSKDFVTKAEELKNQKLNLTVVKLSKTNVSKLLPVSNEEIAAYLASKDNLNKVKALFEKRRPTLEGTEEIRARHILLATEGKDEAAVKTQIEDLAKKVTAKNFIEMAKKFTEDPTGKTNGGDLGTFGKGRMVPEFDNVAFSLNVGLVSAPVKTQFGYHLILVESKKSPKKTNLQEHQTAFATELIQQEKTKEISIKIKEVNEKVLLALEKGDKATLDDLTKKVELQINTGLIANRYDGLQNDKVTLTSDQLSSLFNDSKTVFAFDTALASIFVKKSPVATVQPQVTAPKYEIFSSSESTLFSQKLNSEVMEQLEQQNKVKVYNNFKQVQ